MSMADPSAEAALSSSPTANPTWDNSYFQHTATNHLGTHLVLRQLSLEIRSYSAGLEIHAATIDSQQSLFEIKVFQKLLHSCCIGKYLSFPGKLYT